MFTVGNLITLGIVILILVFYRLTDKSNRSLDKVRKYADRCKDDITAYIEEKGAAIKNYGIALDVERKAATELMRRIQTLTREELALKIQTLGQIDERIRDYDTSLEELVQMTGRVQENLSRIQEESDFVESVSKRVIDVKDKIENAGDDIDTIAKKLEGIERQFRKENAESMEKVMEAAVSSAKSAVMDFETSAQTIEKKIEEHRAVIIRVERERDQRMSRDEEKVEKLITEAIDRAGNIAERIEESALAKLRDQAQERMNQTKTNFEEKIKTAQETLKSKLGDIQEQLKTNREEWKAESASIKDRQKVFSDVWKKDIMELNSFGKQQMDEWNKNIDKYNAMLKKQGDDLKAIINKQDSDLNETVRNHKVKWDSVIREHNDEITDAVKKLKTDLSTVSRDIGKEAIATAEQRLNEFNHVQEERYRQLADVSGDTARLESELRIAMRESMNRVNSDFAAFGKEIRDEWESASGDLNNQVDVLRQDLASLERELNGIKEKSFENVSKKLQGFEDEFLENLTNRSADFDHRFTAWQEEMDKQLESIAENAEAKRNKYENKTTEEARKNIAALGEKIASDIGDYGLSVSETIHRNRSELETQINEFSKDFKDRIAALESSSEQSRKSIDEWHKKSREMAAENEERITANRTALDGIKRELAEQEKLFDRTNALKAEIDGNVEEMKENESRLSQLKKEMARFDNQFTQIKRLEDDVNAKMTRFLSEKHRIEVMENDFNRLLQTSHAVEEKLTQVSNSDDILQTIQVHIRRLEDAIKDTEEKYQRMERKSKTIQETTSGIDRNFKVLQEDETNIKRLEDMVSLLKTDLDSIQKSIEILSKENEKAKDVADKISTLDESVIWLEKRISEMNVARQGLARLATEMQNLDKDAQAQLRLTRSLLDREAVKAVSRGKGGPDEGAPPPRDRENIIKLKRQGWKVDEIARTLKMSKGEVELILELGSKDL